jgi:hypothetical protein
VTNREALELLCDKQDDYDIIAFGCLKKLLIMNIGVLQSDHCGRYYYEYDINDKCDYITDFTISCGGLKFTPRIVIGLDEYEADKIRELILVAAVHSPIKLRVYFDAAPNANMLADTKPYDIMPNSSKEIRIHYTAHICSNSVVYRLTHSTVLTDLIVYSGGMCINRELTKYKKIE